MENVSNRKEMCCPLNGKMCIEGKREDFAKNKAGAPETCRWWIHLYGADPQTGGILDQFDCAVAWLPTTTIETAQKTNQVSAEVNEVRKEVRKAAYITKKLTGLTIRAGRALVQLIEKRTARIDAHTELPPPNGNGDHHEHLS